VDCHEALVGTESPTETAQTGKTEIKNILNCLLHFFVFESMTGHLLIDLIRYLLKSFAEPDIEILIFVLHNIGLQLRKEEPTAIKDIIELAEQKKNSYIAHIKMAEADNDPAVDEMKQKLRKINFLSMELADIKNNKGATTLQVRSIEHL